MNRGGLRTLLVVTAVGYVVAVAFFTALGRAELPDGCGDDPLVRAALDLADAGDVEQGRDLLTERRSAQLGPDADVPASPSTECVNAALSKVGQQRFSDVVVAGVAESLAAAVPFVPEGTTLSSGAATTVRFVLWFVPTVVVLLSMREFLISRLDRRPGPVNVRAISVAGAEDSRSVEADLARALADIELDPSSRTPGGIGEIVVPVIEASETGGGAIATAASLAKQLVLPKSGFEMDCHFREVAGKHEATVTVRTARDGRVLRIGRVSGKDRGEAARRAATVAYFEVHRFPPIRRRAASWSLWSNPEALADYIELSPEATSGELQRFVEDEPGNLAVRLRFAGRLLTEAEREMVADRRALLKWVQSTQAAAAAVRRARRLVEPRAQLAIALALGTLVEDRDGAWTAEERDAVERTRGMLRDLALAHPRVLLGPLRPFPRTWARTNLVLELRNDRARYLLLRGVSRGAIWSLRAPATWWRWLTRPRLRRSIPGSTLLPFSRERRASIHNLRSIAIYARLHYYRHDPPPTRDVYFLTRCELRLLRMRHWLNGEISYQTYTRYNLLLCYALLGDAHQPPDRRVEQQYEHHLQLVFFDLANQVSRKDVADLFQDIDLKPRHQPLREWVMRSGLALTDAKPTSDPPPNWSKIAAERVLAWRDHLQAVVGVTYTRTARLRMLIATETVLAGDIDAVTGVVNPPAGSVPPHPAEQLERVRAAIVDDETRLTSAALEAITRERLARWTALVDELEEELPRPEGDRDASLPTPA